MFELNISFKKGINMKKNANNVILSIMPKKLKEFRQRAGLGVEEASKKIHKSPAMITNYEKGKSIPPASILFELCNIYGVSEINEIFSNNYWNEDFKCNECLTKSEFKLIQLWRTANKEGQTAAKAVLKAFQKRCNNKMEKTEKCLKN